MEVQSPSSPREEGADETVVEHTEAESESNNAEDSDGPSEDRQELVSSEAPEDPNPFLVDDPEEPASSEDGSSAADSEEEGSTPAEEIALAQSVVELPLPATPVTALSAVEAHPLASPVMQVNNPMPPAPASQVVPTVTGSSSSSDEEDEPPTLYISGLTVPTMFLPIPNTDALSTLLAKYIPAEQRPRRDVTGEWQRSDYHTLVMTNSWRALARMARDRIVATDPGEVALLLNVRASLRLVDITKQLTPSQVMANHEMANLFSVLSPPAAITSSNTLSTQPSGSSVSASTTGTSLSSYPSISSLNLPSMQHRSTLSQTEHEHLRDNLMPFELEVLRAKSKYWEGDHMGYLDELRALLGRCKKMSRRACKGPKGRGAVRDEQAVGMWKERGARVCLIMASQLIEMKDFTAATTLLSSLLSPFSPTSSPRLRAALGRVHLQSGNLTAAADHFTQVAEDPTAPRSLVVINTALLSVAEGNWDKAVTALKGIVDDKDREGNGGIEEKERYVAANNLAVAMLSQGHLKEGILVLEETLKASPSTAVSAEPMLFNLSTLYELRANIVSEKKRELLVERSTKFNANAPSLHDRSIASIQDNLRNLGKMGQKGLLGEEPDAAVTNSKLRLMDESLSQSPPVPPELLSEIFLNAVDPADLWRSLKSLTHVCHQREVALNTPLLWQDLEFYNHWPYGAFEELFKRSRVKPIRMDIRYSANAPVMMLPTSELARVDVLRLFCRNYLLLSEGTSDLPALRELHLTFEHPPSALIPFLSLRQPLTRLEVVHTTGLPYDRVLPFFRPTLRTLHLHHVRDGPRLPIGALLQALCDMPLLEELYISHTFSASASLPTVELSNLRKLHLESGTSMCCDILDRLVIPTSSATGAANGSTSRKVVAHTNNNQADYYLHELSRSVVSKLDGVRIVGAVPPCDTLKLVINPYGQRRLHPLTLEAWSGAYHIFTWCLDYGVQHGPIELYIILGWVLTAFPARLLEKLRTLHVSVEADVEVIPQSALGLTSLEVVHLRRSRGIIIDLSQQHTSLDHTLDPTGTPILLPSIKLPFPDLHTISMDSIEFHSPWHNYSSGEDEDVMMCLWHLLALRNSAGAPLALLTIRNATSFTHEDAEKLRLQVVVLDWDGIVYEDRYSPRTRY
ncbi:hypothetical protein EUX98_g1725 [Antrodiella citrinella]|uniref:F-box domain-containing protein n=1 Tax=Antrodiella citrinella TaxID=2447956 RepID=A0A4S4N335_9APHY|nr:hypothetical protein EUX98_g1725 [Antrodiella citrinella]